MGHLNILKGSDAFLGSRELKAFIQMVEAQWGAYPKSFDGLTFIRGRDRIFILTRDVEQIAQSKLGVNSTGLYIAEVKGDTIRLSIEGSQLIGPVANKNICDISRDQVKEWFQGEDIQVDGLFGGFVILKCGDDYVGSGRFKDGMILNFVPKARRLIDIH